MSKILITGSSHGLGSYMAKEFARLDNDIWLHGRNAKALGELHDEITNMGVKSGIICADFNDEKSFDTLARIIAEDKINVVVNNAFNKADCMKSLEWQIKVLDLSISTMKNYHISGFVININSISGHLIDSKVPLYSAAKHGLKGYSESIKFDAIKNNIKITDVYPGAIRTGMNEGREDFNELMSPVEVAYFISTLIWMKTCYVDSVVIRRL